jgi:hypothetical protein
VKEVTHENAQSILLEFLDRENISMPWLVDTLIKVADFTNGHRNPPNFCNWLYNISHQIHINNMNVSDFNYKKFPFKLNLGCGADKREGYLNIDLQPFFEPDLVADIRELKTLPSNTYEEILANDCLEHLPRNDTERTLIEWNRVLKQNGLLRLRVPSATCLFEQLTWESKQSVEDQKLLIQVLYGTQNYEGDWHYTSFTKPLLNYYLNTSGFNVLTMDIKDHSLFVVEAIKR